MKLPIRTLPTYSIHLPASDVTVSYRPHTVKEEQILNMASLNDSPEDKLNAVFQICENCVDYDINKLFPAEIEYLFMKIKACSDSPKVPVIYNVEPEIVDGKNIHEHCGNTINSAFDIDKDIEVVIDNEMEKYATRGKDGTWVIDLKEGIKIQIRVKPLIDINDDSIYELVESIIDEENDTIMFKDANDFSKEEFTEWVGGLSSKSFDDFNKFMACTPKCVAHLKFKCKCGKVIKEDEEGLIRFLV